MRQRPGVPPFQPALRPGPAGFLYNGMAAPVSAAPLAAVKEGKQMAEDPGR